MTPDKQTLRIQARRHRGMIPRSPQEFEAAALHFKKSWSELGAQIVGAYWPMGSEFDVRPALDEVLKAGAALALPVPDPARRMLDFYLWDGQSELEPGLHEAMIPAKRDCAVLPDVLLVPLLAYDRKGYRLGQGGGYYDVTLRSLRESRKVIAIGAAYAQQACLFPLPVEDHDEKLDAILTPEGLQYFPLTAG